MLLGKTSWRGTVGTARHLTSLLGLLVACHSENRAAPSTHSRVAADGAIENDAPGPWTPRWRVPLDSATISIGDSEDPDYDFDAVAEAVRMSDGRLVVATRGPWPLRVYGPTGKLEKKFREGGGPEEVSGFDTALTMGCGDTVVVGHMSLHGQFKLLTSDLKLSRPMRPTGKLANGSQMLVEERDCEGRWYGRGESPPREGAELAPTTRWVTVDRDLESDRVLAEFPGNELAALPGHSKDRPRLVGVIYGRLTVTTMKGHRLYLALNQRPEIEVRAAGTDSVQRIRVSLPEVPVTSADRDPWLTLLARDTRSPQAVENEVVFAKRFNYFMDIVVSPDGWIWALRATTLGGPQEYLVFSPEGKLAATARLPAESWIKSVSGEDALVEWRTKDGASMFSVVRIRT